MVRFWFAIAPLFLVVLVACDEGMPLAPREGLVLEPAEEGLPESDAPAVVRVVREGPGGQVVAERARDAVSVRGEVYRVLEDGRLVVGEGAAERVLLEGVTRGIAVLDDGSVVAPRAGDEPGETDLWIVPPEGKPRPLAPAKGPDDGPIALPDGRVAFVSGRTTVASLWVVDPKTGQARQLTNRGLVAGGARKGFVPPPAGRTFVVDGNLVYDAGGGELWQVDLETGCATRVSQAPEGMR